MSFVAERALAVAAVSKAAAVTEFVRTGDLLKTLTKDDKSPVTVADFAAQAIVNMEIHRVFPGDRIVGEEDADSLREDTEEARVLRAKIVAAVKSVDAAATEQDVLRAIDNGADEGGSSGRFWALDPIDGTKGFLRNDQYAVALGLIQDGRPVLGCLGCPNLPLDLKQPEGARGVGFVAVTGQGCEQFQFAAQDTFAASKTTGCTDPTLACFVESVESGHTAHDISSIVASTLGIVAPGVKMDSQCKYAVLARGDADIYLRLPRPGKRYEEKIWDHAAGVVVMQEAGGKVTDIHGKDLDFSLGRTLKDNTGVAGSSSPELHDKVIAALKSAYAAQEAS
eukprot:m.355888 g.355888  ORF g.355888 m.355888 type:complete len:338 (+) comp17373_c0_seq1:76-1089(+)